MFWNWLIDKSDQSCLIPNEKTQFHHQGVRLIILFVHRKLIIETGMISELIVYEIGGIK
jgi:hypothetical protein